MIAYYTSKTLVSPLSIYSHATVQDGIVYTSAIQGFIPGTLKLPRDLEDETNQMISNLLGVLDDVGSSFDRIVNFRLYVVDLDPNLRMVNKVMKRYISHHSPSRSTIGVFELPRLSRVAMDCIALVKV